MFRTVFEINGDFSLNLLVFPHPRVFCAHAQGVPLGIGYRKWESKTRMMALLGRERSLTISSAVWIQCTNVTDGQTDGRRDGRTPGYSKDCAYA